MISVLAFTPLIQGGCGGGGGGGGGGGLAPATEATTSSLPLATLDASSAPDSVELLSGLSAIEDALQAGNTTTVSSSSAERAELSMFDKMQGIINRVADETRTQGVHSLGVEPDIPPEPCTGGGGTMKISLDWDGNEGPIDALDCHDVSNLHAVIALTKCEEAGVTMNGTMEITFPGSACVLENGNPTDMNMVVDGSFDETATNSTFLFDHLSMQASNIQWDADDNITDMDLLLNGTVSGNMDGNDFRESYSDLTLSMAFLSDAANGDYYSMNVDGYILPTCLDGWLEITTHDPVLIPEDLPCPFGGSYTARGSDTSVQVTFHGDTSVEISLNGELQTYPTCEDVPSCL